MRARELPYSVTGVEASRPELAAPEPIQECVDSVAGARTEAVRDAPLAVAGSASDIGVDSEPAADESATDCGTALVVVLTMDPSRVALVSCPGSCDSVALAVETCALALSSCPPLGVLPPAPPPDVPAAAAASVLAVPALLVRGHDSTPAVDVAGWLPADELLG